MTELVPFGEHDIGHEPQLVVVGCESIAKQPDAPEKNEDYWAASPRAITLSDGATDKTGLRYPDPYIANAECSGGRLASYFAVAACQTAPSGMYGIPLVERATRRIQDFYYGYNPGALEDSSKRFGATLVDARIVHEEGEEWFVVTRVGDSNYRVTLTDGTDVVVSNGKLVDEINGRVRSEYILGHPDDVEGGRQAIMDALKSQHRHQNDPDPTNPYAYGVIDGSPVPARFVEVRKWRANQVAAIELYTDGYPENPVNTPGRVNTVADYEAAFATVAEEDPLRIGLHGHPVSTKVADDRTVVVAEITL